MEIKYIIESLQKEDIEIDEKKALQLYKFYELIIEKNKVMNLTRITEFKDFVKKHIVDSLMIERILDLEDKKNLIDIGTGAGFPGIPIKIVHERLNITLLDSLAKRLRFLDEVIERLELDNIETLHSRAEDTNTLKRYRESFDVVTSRAVGSLPTLLEYCMPYVRLSGVFLAYKGAKANLELLNSKKAIEVLGGKLLEEVEFTIKDTDYKRTLFLIKKIKSTPLKYPRQGGKPSKEPIS